MKEPSNFKPARWRYALPAAAAMILLALYPQVAFRRARGDAWHGAHAYAHGDEAVYASYTNALIDGRPRRSDPYTGRDERADAPQPESYFSIQFVPAYAIALAARLFGANVSESFVALSCLAALLSALAVFRLLVSLTGDARLAATGVLVVLCLGSAHLALAFFLTGEASNNQLPFLRRYLPSAPFPLFFVFCALVWHMLARESVRARLASAVGAGAAFALLVFSYFYLWTTAAAWLACLALLRLLLRPDERRQSLPAFGIVAASAVAALIPYFVLLSKRVGTTDEALLLTRSHAPDLFRLPELVGILVITALALAARRKRLDWQAPEIIFTTAFALTPFLVFNQQIVTGRSLQPFHYGMFIVNYTTALAAFLSAAFIWRGRAATFDRRAVLIFTALALVALCSGAVETTLASKRFMQANILRDEARPAALRLRTFARAMPAVTTEAPRADKAQPALESQTGTGAQAETRTEAVAQLDTNAVVFVTDFTVADALPNVAPQPVLWSPHMFNFPGVSLQEDRERLAQYLYFTGADFSRIDAAKYAALDGRTKYFISSLIRRSRHNPNLTVDWTPITPAEVRAALDFYTNFTAGFDRRRASRPLLSYLLTSDQEQMDFTNLERWYAREAGERFGRFTLYRLRLRDEEGH